MTEGIARRCAGYGIVYGDRRTARMRMRWVDAGLSWAAGGNWPQQTVIATLLALMALALSPSLVAEGGGHAPAGMEQSTSLSAARLKRLPIQAQAVVSTTLGADRPIFAPHPTRLGYTLAGGGVTATIGRGRVVVGATGGSTSLALQAVGRGRALRAVTAAPPIAHANRVVYPHGNVAEWYAAGPLGLEQGYTVARRLSGVTGPLVLATATRGSLLIHRSGSGLVFSTHSGVVLLRYGGLEAVDATGRRLPATIAVRNDRLLIRVDDRRARYPVRIDPFIQQGQKLTANDTTFPDRTIQGVSLAVSQDGNTLLVGGPGEGAAGAAWAFSNVGGVWTQQGGKLTPNNASPPSGGSSSFGDSVALSSNGSVALIGAPFDQNQGSTVPQAGAAWVFSRSGTTWSQGSRLIPNNAIVATNDHGSLFGSSVALSGDGTTALIGGWFDNNFAGAAWVFSTSGTQLQKLTPPSDATTTDPAFGKAVALSDDGSTALIAGTDEGGVWAYTRSGSTYVQQSPKLTPRDGNPGGGGSFGSALALSQNGSTALIGGAGDSGQAGAAWVFTRSGTTWSQQGPKLTPSDETNAPAGGGFGTSVALSADGNTALIGAPFDFNNAGAAWTFVRSGSTWGQRGSKIAVNTVAGNEQGQGEFGSAVGLSGDGIRALIGAPNDNNIFGAVWAFDQVPSCAGQAASAPPGGGSVTIALSCVGPVGQPITYAIAAGPSHGGVGSINQATGAITYVSQPGFNGSDSFTYLATDAGGASQPATVTITVPPAPPTCAAASAKSAPGGGATSVKLSCTSPAGVGIQYAIVSAPAHGTLSALNQSAGSAVYTPSPRFHGTDAFTYDASDSGGTSSPATATIAVPPGPPICGDIGSSTTGESSITVQLSCTGPAGIRLTYAIVSRPAHGVLGAVNQAHHSVVYTPGAGYAGHDHFTYRATDSGGKSKPATAAITVQGSLAFALLGWNFNSLSRYSQVASMTASGVPAGTKIAASCRGNGCHMNAPPVTVTNTTTCPSNKGRCRHKSRPHTHNVDLTPALRGARFPVGSTLTVSLTKRGFIGKAYVFNIRPNRQPTWKASCLAPGSLVPGKGC